MKISLESLCWRIVNQRLYSSSKDSQERKEYWNLIHAPIEKSSFPIILCPSTVLPLHREFRKLRSKIWKVCKGLIEDRITFGLIQDLDFTFYHSCCGSLLVSFKDLYNIKKGSINSPKFDLQIIKEQLQEEEYRKLRDESLMKYEKKW